MDDDEEESAEEEGSDEEPPAKKAKPAGPMTFSFMYLPDMLDDDKFSKWLSKQVKKAEIISMRANWRRNKAFVDIDGSLKDKILALSGTSFNGNDIEVTVDEKGPGFGNETGPRTGQSFDDRRKQRSGEKDARTLFVRGIPYSADEDALWGVEHFANAAAIRLMRDQESGESRGFGFIEFNDEAAADAAYEKRFDAQLDGRNLMFDFCGDKSTRNQEGGRGRGRGGGRGRGRGGFGDRGGFGGRGRGRGRGGFGGDRGGRGRGRGRGRGGFSDAAARNKGHVQEFAGKKMTFGDSD